MVLERGDGQFPHCGTDLRDEQKLIGLFQFPLPAVPTGNPRQNLYAGSQSVFHKHSGQAVRFFLAASGAYQDLWRGFMRFVFQACFPRLLLDSLVYLRQTDHFLPFPGYWAVLSVLFICPHVLERVSGFLAGPEPAIGDTLAVLSCGDAKASLTLSA